MKVLVIGSGGREHAIAWRLACSASVTEVLCAPGNPGIAELGRCVPVAVEDREGLLELAVAERPQLVVIGPEAPLVAGLADDLRGLGLRVFGPGCLGAMVEASKSFAKELMAAAGVPTAAHRSFDTLQPALDYVRDAGAPIVIKADGLAAGKGVVVARTVQDAERALRQMLVDQALGEAGATVVVEEFLVGREVTIMALVSGQEIRLLAPSRDHKRAWDHDRGPNTGGMGALSPVPDVDARVLRRVEREVLRPFVAQLRTRGIDYRGVLYAGLMLCADGPRVIEFNARFGDPEAQVVLPRLEGDFAELCCAVADGRLAQVPELTWSPQAACTVVVAAEGYPEQPRRGDRVQLPGEHSPALHHVADRGERALVFQAAVASSLGGALVTSGGRVAAATGIGASPERARELAYASAGLVRFEGAWCRSDIAATAAAVPAAGV